MNTFIGTLTGQSLCGGKMILISNSHATRWHKLTLTATSPMRWLLKQMRLRNEKKKEAQERSRTHGMPSDQRVQRFLERPEIRSTQSGGANTRPRVGTFEERRALQAIRWTEKGKKGKGKSKGKTGGKTYDL